MDISKSINKFLMTVAVGVCAVLGCDRREWVNVAVINERAVVARVVVPSVPEVLDPIQSARADLSSTVSRFIPDAKPASEVFLANIESAREGLVVGVAPSDGVIYIPFEGNSEFFPAILASINTFSESLAPAFASLLTKKDANDSSFMDHIASLKRLIDGSEIPNNLVSIDDDVILCAVLDVVPRSMSCFIRDIGDKLRIQKEHGGIHLNIDKLIENVYLSMEAAVKTAKAKFDSILTDMRDVNFDGIITANLDYLNQALPQDHPQRAYLLEIQRVLGILMDLIDKETNTER